MDVSTPCTSFIVSESAEECDSSHVPPRFSSQTTLERDQPLLLFARHAEMIYFRVFPSVGLFPLGIDFIIRRKRGMSPLVDSVANHVPEMWSRVER